MVMYFVLSVIWVLTIAYLYRMSRYVEKEIESIRNDSYSVCKGILDRMDKLESDRKKEKECCVPVKECRIDEANTYVIPSPEVTYTTTDTSTALYNGFVNDVPIPKKVRKPRKTKENSDGKE